MVFLGVFFVFFLGGFFIANPAYRELCGLATDMGQPDLVYKFMHLANYNATWNSRKGEQATFIWQIVVRIFWNGNGPGERGSTFCGQK